MFWRSVVGKLAVTILLLVSFVLLVLTILLLEFFENYHIDEAKKQMLQTAEKVSILYEEYDSNSVMEETVERVKDPSSRVALVLKDGTVWNSSTTDKSLGENPEFSWYRDYGDFDKLLNKEKKMHKEVMLPGTATEVMLVGIRLPKNEGAVYVLQSLEMINRTKAETTKIIFVAAGTAIILTTVFAFFLSTRITAPLIKMREAAFDLARGKFDTKVPILTHDEIGELAIAFNRMGRQLNMNIQALSEEKEQLSSIMNSMADGVATMNREGTLIVSNPTAEILFNHYAENEGEERKVPPGLAELLQQIIGGEKEVEKEISHSGRYWVIIMTPLYDKENEVRGAVAVIRDMTAERRLDKLRKDFIANVSHELRTPISLLQGYSEAIVDDIAETVEDKNELAGIIHEESLRMGRLVNELLDLARMESGQITLHPTEVPVQEFISKIAKKFQGIAQENKVELKINVNNETANAFFDPDRLEQVFTNLIDNALRHTEEFGSVQIDVRNTREAFSAQISDTGSGIPQEDLPFVFERFYKADKSRTRKQRGTGLGLSIAKNIMEAHGGTISVSSEIGKGTVFSLTVPDNLKEDKGMI
ncbi:ATP-binding protein [Aciduricibacillus chroicocephali]|uniref:histidine kinase n=1 Tax=Aciduricibacillus chroicocephali TaxID=3054939 RepID=A0ABY9KRM5_9BACI|nr:ATP-binding protein [Bacillaceae bacterium 44XB]